MKSKYVSEHIFQCAITPADKKIGFECGGSNICSSVCVLHKERPWTLLFWLCKKHLSKEPRIPDRDWQVSLSLRNAEDGNIKSASKTTGVLMLLCWTRENKRWRTMQGSAITTFAECGVFLKGAYWPLNLQSAGDIWAIMNTGSHHVIAMVPC